jgi:predicted permease
METLFNTLSPIFGIILLGFLACKCNLLAQEESAILNKFVYFISFPSLLFVVMAKAPMEKIFYWDFIGAWGLGLFATFIVTAIISAVLWKESLSRLSINCLNTTCSSTAFMGVPLIYITFGQEATVAAIIATTFLVAIIISLSIFLIELDQDGNTSATGIVRNIGASLARNPLMMGAVLGILCSALITLPKPVDQLFDMVGKAAIPISLFSIGLFIAGQSLAEIKKSLFQVNVLILVKLVIHPLINWFLIDQFFTLDPVWSAITIILAGLPPATTCFVIAQRYNVSVSETASMTVLSTLYSVISISLILIMLSII